VRVAILDDIHRAYEATAGVRRLRERAEVRIFTSAFGEPAALPLGAVHVVAEEIRRGVHKGRFLRAGRGVDKGQFRMGLGEILDRDAFIAGER